MKNLPKNPVDPGKSALTSFPDVPPECGPQPNSAGAAMGTNFGERGSGSHMPLSSPYPDAEVYPKPKGNG